MHRARLSSPPRTADRHGARAATGAEPERAVRRLRLFAASADEPRARQATDVILLLVATGGLVIASAVAVPHSGFERALIALATGLPRGLDDVWEFLADLFVLFAIALFALALVRRRISLVRDLALAGAVAFVSCALLARVVLGSWSSVSLALRSAADLSSYPALRLAIASAVVMTASPHLAKPLRRVGRWGTGTAALATVLLGSATPTGAVAALLVAIAGASAVHLVFGSCRGRPDLADIAAALTALGVATRTLGAADRQPSGLFVVDAQDEAGDPLVVKVYGRDAHDTNFLTRLYRAVWFREAGSQVSLGRRQQVEHEALVTMLAREAGIVAPYVAAVGITDDEDVILVTRPVGIELMTVPERWTTGLGRRAWTVLGVLHGARIVHGELDDRNIVVARSASSADEIGLSNFRSAAIGAAPEQLRKDEAQLVVATALGLGPEAATTLARECLGAERLAAVLPFVQLTALTGRQRSEVSRLGLDLDAIRTRAAELAGVEPPQLQKIRRVTFGSVIQVAMFAFAFVALASAVGGLDLDSLGSQLRDATWWFLVAGLLIAQLPRFTQAIAALGASPTPVPLGPLYGLQLATSYIGIAVPTSAARIAINVRFFQRRGLPAGTALAVGALDGFAGFIVQVVLLLSIVAFTSASLELQLDGGVPAGLTHLVVLIVSGGLIAVATIAVVGTWRRWVLGWIQRLTTEALNAVKGLTSTRRIGMLFGGNLASEVLFALALGTFARAFGYSIGLTDLLLINISVALLAGVLPIPGGVGVFEGGLTLGLVRAGMPEETAFAAVLLYRLASFYLPPIWGFFAFRWLQRNQQI